MRLLSRLEDERKSGAIWLRFPVNRLKAPNEHCIAIAQAATNTPNWASCSGQGTGLTNRDLKNLAGASADASVPHRKAQRGNDGVARSTKIGMSPALPLLSLPIGEATKNRHRNWGLIPPVSALKRVQSLEAGPDFPTEDQDHQLV
jgi:hypothetical protein